MYDILDLYQDEYDWKRPAVGFDEKPKQLVADGGKKFGSNQEVLKNMIMSIKETVK